MQRVTAIVVGVMLGLGAMAGAADAVPFYTISKAQEAQRSDNNNWVSVIGSIPPFGTTKIDLEMFGADLRLRIFTKFDVDYFGAGAPCLGSPTTCANAADLAINLRPSGDSVFEYGIALGQQSKAPGFYSVTDWNTSQDEWSGVGGVVYGKQWRSNVPNDPTPPNYPGGQLADVKIVAGTKLLDVTVSAQQNYIDVTIDNWAAWANAGDFSVFWGTADCANDPIWGDVPMPPNFEVPEPGTLALLGTGLVGLGAVIRRRARAKKTGN